MTPTKHIVYLGLGTNLGNKKQNIKTALELLSQKTTLLKSSSVYETKPFGYTQQDNFLNSVIKVETDLDPQALLFFTQFVEEKMGRKVTFKNGPRIIDVDILLYDDLVLELSEITIPHPRMHERDSVLVPLKEIAPNLIHPVKNQMIKEIEQKLNEHYILRKIN